jgi:hypothetical protein
MSPGEAATRCIISRHEGRLRKKPLVKNTVYDKRIMGLRQDLAFVHACNDAQRDREFTASSKIVKIQWLLNIYLSILYT